jgi:hypothetical protein
VSLRLTVPKNKAWIDSYQQKLGEAGVEQLQMLTAPERAAQPQSNSTPQDPKRRVSKDGFVTWDDPTLGPAQSARARVPHFLRYGRASMRGRKWDHLRSAEPVIVAGYSSSAWQQPVAWQDFLHSSAWGHIPYEKSEVVDYQVLNTLQPNFNRDTDMDVSFTRPYKSRGEKTLALPKRIWNVAVRHTLSPLIFRLTVMVTSILAMGIAARIYKVEGTLRKDSAEGTQSLVAVIVDCVAIPYSAYMIWDEYTGKPLGLRSAISKISLILLDLFFIIFKSASTALAFESLLYHNIHSTEIQNLADALAAFMLIGLIAWTMNLTVNIFRTVERLGGGENDYERV